MEDPDKNGAGDDGASTATTTKPPESCIDLLICAAAAAKGKQSVENNGGSGDTKCCSGCEGQGVYAHKSEHKCFERRENVPCNCCARIQGQPLERLEREMESLKKAVLHQTSVHEADKEEARVHRLALQAAVDTQNSTLNLILAAVSPSAVQLTSHQRLNCDQIAEAAPCVAPAAPSPTPPSPTQLTMAPRLHVQKQTAGENGVSRIRETFQAADADVCFGDYRSENHVGHAVPDKSAVKASFPERRWDYTLDGDFSPAQPRSLSSKPGQQSFIQTPNPSLNLAESGRSRSLVHSSSQLRNAQQICPEIAGFLDAHEIVATIEHIDPAPVEVVSTHYFQPRS